ncbi:hypothetical protein ACP4OV_003789 [Aristida adscensionis]
MPIRQRVNQPAAAPERLSSSQTPMAASVDPRRSASDANMRSRQDGDGLAAARPATRPMERGSAPALSGGNFTSSLRENIGAGRSHKLVVEVVSANGLADDTEFVSACVELRFDGESSITSVKRKVRHPEWRERFCFSVPNKGRLPGLSLEAYVYNVDELTDRKNLIGRVRIAGATIANSSSEAPWGYQLSGRTNLLGRSIKAVLILKVSLMDDHEQQGVAADSSDPLSAANPFNIFNQSTKEPLLPGEDARVKEIAPDFEEGRLVESMPYIFVRVIKARGLPDVDATGSLDPFVEVRAGAYRAVTKYLKKDQNPEWNATFAFCTHYIRMCRMDVTVMDKDKIRDDFVGKLSFDQSEIPLRLPADSPVSPVWHQLLDQHGKITEGELMIAIWKCSSADEAYPEAWHAGPLDLDVSLLPYISPKVYDFPTLWYVRICIIDFEDFTVGNDDEQSKKMYVSVSVAGQLVRTRFAARQKRSSYVWNEDLLLVAAEPLESHVRIYVKENIGPGQDNIVGQTTIALASLEKRLDHHLVGVHVFEIQRPLEADGDKDEQSMALGIIRLRNCLEGGYKVLYHSTYNIDDLRPTVALKESPPIGLLELGILGAQVFHPTKTRGGKNTSDIYCVAKYGGKWARTRTVINTVKPAFNEQYSWDVFDTAAVVTIGVFDNGATVDKKDKLLGEVQLRLSYLQPGIIYANAYPLFQLQPSGLKTMGELYMAVRFSLTTAMVNAVCMYSRPRLPRMNYASPLTIVQIDRLRSFALEIVATRMSQMEDRPLRKEVVEKMLEVRSHLFSIRKSKANFFRLMQAISGVVFLLLWFDKVRLWRSPATTLLAYAIFGLALWFHQLILPFLFLYILVIVCWNYRFRPRFPPHYDVRLSHATTTDPDELDEEFDTFPTSRDPDTVRRRYDRLRSIAGRLQAVVGDVATQLERVQALVSWRDPTATVIVGLFASIAAIMLYYVPYKILVAAAWIYIMRPPMFRSSGMPSFLANFIRRLPDKMVMLL